MEALHAGQPLFSTCSETGSASVKLSWNERKAVFLNPEQFPFFFFKRTRGKCGAGSYGKRIQSEVGGLGGRSLLLLASDQELKLLDLGLFFSEGEY